MKAFTDGTCFSSFVDVFTLQVSLEKLFNHVKSKKLNETYTFNPICVGLVPKYQERLPWTNVQNRGASKIKSKFFFTVSFNFLTFYSDKIAHH